jgi:hypothetical protein
MKNIAMLAVIAVFAAGAAFAQEKAPAAAKAAGTSAPAAKHECAGCPMHKKGACPMCPEKLKGVQTVSRSIPGGVEITMTAKDKAAEAKVQELARAHYGPKAQKCPSCPAAVPGAEVKVENTADGVRVTVTGGTPEVVKKIQVAGGRRRETGPAAKISVIYVCPMDGYRSDKPGKCPKCGMELKEKEQ